MSATATQQRPAAAERVAKKPTSQAAGSTTLGQDHSREAQRLAAVILEVLAGTRTPAQAATALSVSLPRYYQLEARALRGLVDSCEARPRGPGRSVDKELTTLRRQQQRLQQELQRQQTLLRLAQRTLGLPAAPAPAPKPAAGKKRRRPAVRALRAAAQLQQQSQEAPIAAPTVEEHKA